MSKKIQTFGKLQFNEAKHKYTYNKVELESVTKYIKQWFAPFDEKSIARKLNKMKPTKWYRMGVRTILALWKAQREDGTLVHKQLEQYIRGDEQVIEESWHPKTVQGIQVYHKLVKKLGEPISNSEVRVYNIDWLLAGTIDLVIEHNQELLGKETNKRVVSIVDWKTNSTLKFKSDSFALPPFQGLPDCNFTQYSLQLNLYALMFEKQFDVVVDGIYIAHLLEDDAKVYIVPDLRKELLEVLNNGMG